MYEWRVLDINANNYVFIITEYVLATPIKYHDGEQTDLTWENISIRSILNNVFYSTFNNEEK